MTSTSAAHRSIARTFTMHMCPLQCAFREVPVVLGWGRWVSRWEIDRVIMVVKCGLRDLIQAMITVQIVSTRHHREAITTRQ